jgi:hypothetical protein
VRTYRPIARFEPLGWIVATIDPPCLLVLHEPQRSDIINSSWAFVLERDGRRTRLLSRWRFRRRGAAHTVFKWLAFDPAAWKVAFCSGGDASRDVARVVSDVSVLCPCAVVGFDN